MAEPEGFAIVVMPGLPGQLVAPGENVPGCRNPRAGGRGRPEQSTASFNGFLF